MIDAAARVGRFAPALILSLLVTAVAWRLASVPPQFPHRQWLVEEPSTLAARPLPLVFAGFINGADTFRLPLTTNDLPALIEFDEFGFAFGDEFTKAVFIEASLAVDGTACRWNTPPRTTFVNNEALWFVRHQPCHTIATRSNAALTLEVRLVSQSGRVALWTFEDPTSEPRLLDTRYNAQRFAVRGFAGKIYPPSSLSRAHLLAAVWNVTAGQIWARFLFSMLALVAGVALLVASDRRGPGIGRLFAALGTGLTLTGLALATAVVTPPLQTADEPDHLLTFAALTNRPELPADAERLARRTHFERLRHRYYQHFRAADLGVSWPVAWPATTFAEPITDRSPLTMWWWRFAGRLIPPADAAATIWALRCANALLFGIVVTIAVLVLAASAPARRASLLGLGLIVVPTLPFFAMGLSDTAVNVAVSVPLAAIIAGVVMDGNRGHMLGMPLGISVVLMLLSGRRSWATLAVVSTVLLVRAAIGPRAGGTRATFAFWAGVLVPIALGVWSVFSLGMLNSMVALVETRRSEIVTTVEVLARRWFLIPLLLLSLPMFEFICSILRRVAPRPSFPRVRRALSVVAAAAILVPTLVSRVAAFPTTQGQHVDTLTAADYVWSVMRSMAVPLRTGHFDLMLSTLFWGGFGWSDTVPPEWLIAVVCLATALVYAWLWWQAGQSGTARQALLLAGLMVGLAISLAVTAAGTYALRYDLYGRYLVGWYLLLTTTAWLSPSAAKQPPAWMWIAAPLFIHAYCLQMIVMRYF